MNKIFKAVATVTIFSIITRTLGFFFRIFLSRKLGATGLGIFQMASSVIGVFLTIVSSGLPLSTAKMVTKYEVNNNLKKRNQAVTTSVVIALAVSAVCSLLILALKGFWNIVVADNRAVEIILILIPSITLSAIYAVLRGALWGQNDYFNCGLTELVEQIFRFILTAVLLTNITDTFVAVKNSAVAFNLTCLISAVLTLILYLRRAKFDFSRGEYKNLIKSATPITGVRLSNSLIQPLTALIIPAMLMVAGYSSVDATASYGIIMGMTFPLLYVPMAVIGSISMVLIPTISSLMAKNDYATIKENINTSVKISIYISMLFVTLFLSVGNLIGQILYDNLLSGILLQFAAVCVLPITLCNLTGSVLNALNLEVKSFKNYLLGSLVLLVLLVALTPIFALNTIIIAEFCSMLTITILNTRKIKQAIPNLNLGLKATWKYSLIVAPCSLFGYFISNLCLKILPRFISCVLGGGMAMLAVLILCQIFNLYDLRELINLVLKKRKKQTE